MSDYRWDDLADSEISARLIARNVPPDVAADAVRNREDHKWAAFITEVLNG